MAVEPSTWMSRSSGAADVFVISTCFGGAVPGISRPKLSEGIARLAGFSGDLTVAKSRRCVGTAGTASGCTILPMLGMTSRADGATDVSESTPRIAYAATSPTVRRAAAATPRPRLKGGSLVGSPQRMVCPFS